MTNLCFPLKIFQFVYLYRLHADSIFCSKPRKIINIVKMISVQFQAILLQLLTDRDRLAAHLRSTCEFYRLRRDALYHEMQVLADVAYSPLPNAGLFFWVKVSGVEDVYNMVNIVLVNQMFVSCRPVHSYSHKVPTSSLAQVVVPASCRVPNAAYAETQFWQ